MSDANGAPRLATRREWIGLAVLGLACLVYSMDLTVLHLAVPKMSAALEPSSVQLLWIIDIYGFFVAGSLLTMGTLGDRVGRRRLLLIGSAAFGLTSVLAAFSQTAEMLIASRALMGVAGATVAPGTLSLIFAMFPDPKQRAAAIGLWISAYSAGGAVGPVLGGVLLEYFWWGSVFLLAVPVMAALLILGPRVLPEYRDPGAKRLDLSSAAMSLVAVLALVYALKETAQGGVSAQPAAALGVGLVVGALFIRRERRLEDPLIDLRLFSSTRFNAPLATNVIGIFIAVGYFLFVAQYLQLVLGLTPLVAGLWSLPSAVGFIVASNVAPRYIHRYRPAFVIAACLVLCAASIGLLLLTSVTEGLVVVVVAEILISIALSPVFVLTTELIVGSAPPEKAGAASGVSETGSELGGALGLAILGSIGTAIYRAALTRDLPPGVPPEIASAARDTLGAAVDVARSLPEPTASAFSAAARAAFVDGLHSTSAIAAVVALGAVFIALAFLRHLPAATASADETRAVAAAS